MPTKKKRTLRLHAAAVAERSLTKRHKYGFDDRGRDQQTTPFKTGDF